MGLFSIFSSKDWSHYLNKGDEYHQAERLADARNAYLTALEKLPKDQDEQRMQIEGKLAKVSDDLALLNLREAEGYLSAGDAVRASEYAEFAKTLTTSENIRQMAERITLIPEKEVVESEAAASGGGCSGSCCGSSAPANTEDLSVVENENLEFDFIVGTLPGDLPQRYREMGEKFAKAFIVSRSGETGKALVLFEELLREQGEKDILLYELALLYHQSGRHRDAERLLSRGLPSAAVNPLIPLALVDLYIEFRYLKEARQLLEDMISQEIMADHARFMLGDLRAALGELDGALDTLAPLLTTGSRKEAAKKIAAILMELGRKEEAAHVTKQYLQGKC